MSKLNRFSREHGKAHIFDHLDQADVLIRIDGDFDSPADRDQYVDALVDRLQTSDEVARLKDVIRELDDANNAYAKFVHSDGIEAHRQNRERLIAAWNAARKAAGRDEYSFPLRAA